MLQWIASWFPTLPDKTLTQSTAVVWGFVTGVIVTAQQAGFLPTGTLEAVQAVGDSGVGVLAQADVLWGAVTDLARNGSALLAWVGLRAASARR